MLLTHTGRPIVRERLRYVVRCGNWIVLEEHLVDRDRRGRATQMRRMIARAMRRERRAGYSAAAWTKSMRVQGWIG